MKEKKRYLFKKKVGDNYIQLETVEEHTEYIKWLTDTYKTTDDETLKMEIIGIVYENMLPYFTLTVNSAVSNEEDRKDRLSDLFMNVYSTFGSYDYNKGSLYRYYSEFVPREVATAQMEWTSGQSDTHMRNQNAIKKAIAYFENNQIPYSEMDLSDKTGLSVKVVKEELDTMAILIARQSNKEDDDGLDLLSNQAAPDNSVEDILIEAYQSKKLKDAMNKLTSDERKIINLHFGFELNGKISKTTGKLVTSMPLQAIGEEIGLSPNMTRRTYHRAMDKLKGILTQDAFFADRKVQNIFVLPQAATMTKEEIQDDIMILNTIESFSLPLL